MLERVIGRFTGEEKGPLLICFGGMHGNELAGVQALDLVFKMLEVEPITNPDFRFKGRIVGLRGNCRAIRQHKRYLNKDLNRQFDDENVERILAAPVENLDAEDLELREIITIVRREIADYRPEKVVVLDLHTTSAFGGIFAIVNDDPECLRIARELHAPVITGMVRGIHGTTLHYFRDESFGVRTVAVSFESGQHDEPLSVNRSIAAIINCLRTIGCVRASDVENRHDQLLIDFSKDLPKIAELISAYRISSPATFQLLPGFRNFQQVEKGELIGYENNADIRASENALILMPRYQSQGTDGFFLIRAME